MAFAALALREARIAHQVFAPHCLRQRLELLLLVGGDVEETRLRPERAGRGGGEVIVADRSGFLACHEVVGDDPSHAHDGRVEHRDVDEAALSAFLSSHQRSCDRECRHDAADAIGHGVAGAQRRAFFVAGHAHHARQALDDLVVRRRVAHRTALPEARNRAVHKPRIDRAQLRVAQSQPVHHARAEVLDQHVGRGDQAPQHGLAGVRFQVDRDGLLAAVLGEERGAHAAPVERGIGA